MNVKLFFYRAVKNIRFTQFSLYGPNLDSSFFFQNIYSENFKVENIVNCDDSNVVQDKGQNSFNMKSLDIPTENNIKYKDGI